MKTTNIIKTAVWMALLAGMSVAGLKYVAVVETDVDVASGASAEINAAEVREITAELRRQATENLPRSQYNVMTSETVQSMGGAVLEECAEENCVIALGSKIGADYIVRGTISKFQTRFTLAIELYETDNGTLVVSSEAIRSGNIDELLDKATVACVNMYKKFAELQRAMQKPQAAVDTVLQQPEKKAKPKKEKPAPKPKPEPKPKPPKPAPKPKPPKPAPKPIELPPMKLSAGGGAFLANDFGGGLNWNDGVQVTMPYIGGGAYLFFDATYAEAFAAFSGGGGKWESGNVAATDTTVLPEMSRKSVNIGVFAKYPFTVGNIKLFPLLGIDYEAALSAELNTDGYKYPFDASDLNALWFKFGGGMNAALGEKMYIRAELLYGLRGTNKFEDYESGEWEASIGSAGGVTVRVGMGINF